MVQLGDLQLFGGSAKALPRDEGEFAPKVESPMYNISPIIPPPTVIVNGQIHAQNRRDVTLWEALSCRVREEITKIPKYRYYRVTGCTSWQLTSVFLDTTLREPSERVAKDKLSIENCNLGRRVAYTRPDDKVSENSQYKPIISNSKVSKYSVQKDSEENNGEGNNPNCGEEWAFMVRLNTIELCFFQTLIMIRGLKL